jgi:hypothetical protein
MVVPMVVVAVKSVQLVANIPSDLLGGFEEIVLFEKEGLPLRILLPRRNGYDCKTVYTV